MRRLGKLLAAVAENVALPLGAYGLLVLLGTAPVWALVGSSAVSAAVVGVGYLRTGTVNTLGVLVGAQLVLAIAVAGITGDARLVLVKDAAVTAVVALAVVLTAGARRPFIARVRRDLDPDPDAFDRRWRTETPFRDAHRGLTRLWGTALLAESALLVVLAYALPLPAAVVVTQVLPVPVLLGLIAWTQARIAAVPPSVPSRP